MNPDHWNKRIISGVLRSVTKFCFVRLFINRIEADVMPVNVCCKYLLLKCGLAKEGLLRSWLFWDQKYWDINMLSLIK
ncbi:ribosomal-protein-alanine N-acetyltransferase [Arachidicoccus rhizosphaerae]|jgi:ribosomal-protein-alanine N-acetyltransferase|uniref:Ribosomal-protein-alanine N-acetyltransferase n=1 Tax=Arachidicoccus rhizosphaerae TaxID=551991 RepID=A0A1H3WUN8_9BACT|nr:GNAT family protein [Arachidicoccus rhizosphaerae]SDZ90690.1 ribosomal-protein-alanine N-acetyltransferase [Arachidicoccus rhizosphaerae]